MPLLKFEWVKFIDRQLYCCCWACGVVGGGLPEGPSARCAPAVHKSTGWRPRRL